MSDSEKAAIAKNGLINLYSEPTQASELQGQYLLGEVFTILGSEGRYIKVETEDELTGWLHSGAVVEVDSVMEDDEFSDSRKMICTANFTLLRSREDLESPPSMLVYLGTVVEIDEPITNYYLKTREWLRVRLPDGELAFLFKKDFMVYQNYVEKYHNKPDVAVKTAKSFLGVPYLWGGNSPAGMDCSGLVQLSMHMAGKAMPRNSSQQATLGDKIDCSEDFDALTAGDLVFFSDGDKVNHVGISLGGQRFIHSAVSNGKVQINSFDKKDEDYNRFFREIFKFAKRVGWSPE